MFPLNGRIEVDLESAFCYYNKTLLKNSHNKGNLKMKRFNPETKTFKVFNALYPGRLLRVL